MVDALAAGRRGARAAAAEAAGRGGPATGSRRGPRGAWSPPSRSWRARAGPATWARAAPARRTPAPPPRGCFSRPAPGPDRSDGAVIGLVLVSHSARLADGAAEPARRWPAPTCASPRPAASIRPAARLAPTPTLVAAAIERAWSPDGVLVLMDLGSAVPSPELALACSPPGAPRARAPHGGAARRRGRRRRRGGGAGWDTRHGGRRGPRGLAAKAAHLAAEARLRRQDGADRRVACRRRRSRRHRNRGPGEADAAPADRRSARPARPPCGALRAHGGELRGDGDGRRRDRRARARQRAQPERRRRPRRARAVTRSCARARGAQAHEAPGGARPPGRRGFRRAIRWGAGGARRCAPRSPRRSSTAAARAGAVLRGLPASLRHRDRCGSPPVDTAVGRRRRRGDRAPTPRGRVGLSGTRVGPTRAADSEPGGPLMPWSPPGPAGTFRDLRRAPAVLGRRGAAPAGRGTAIFAGGGNAAAAWARRRAQRRRRLGRPSTIPICRPLAADLREVADQVLRHPCSGCLPPAAAAAEGIVVTGEVSPAARRRRPRRRRGRRSPPPAVVRPRTA